jgi:hypothetical protein
MFVRLPMKLVIYDDREFMVKIQVYTSLHTYKFIRFRKRGVYMLWPPLVQCRVIF